MKEEFVRPRAPGWAKQSLFAVVFLLYFPLIVMVLGAFRTETGWGLEHFVGVLNDEVWLSALYRSLMIAAGSGLVSVVIGTGAALALERASAWLLPGLLTLAMVVPELVFALTLLTWFAWLMLPLSLLTVCLAHVTFTMSFAFLVVRGRLEQIDPQIVEAAADLGARPLTTLWRIKLPLLTPAMVAAFFICFLLSFDDFLISFYVNGVGDDTLPIKLYAAMKIGMTPQLNALATLLAVASGFCLTLVFQSRTVQSILRIK